MVLILLNKNRNDYYSCLENLHTYATKVSFSLKKSDEKALIKSLSGLNQIILSPNFTEIT